MEERLKTLAGVRPVSEWLHQCQQFLQGTAARGNDPLDIEDEILHQILHTDLRHVVRCDNDNDVSMEESSYSTSPDHDTGNDESLSSMALRHAISQSNPRQGGEEENSSSSCKVTLPETFIHMIQIEELLDVSKNAEDRLSHGPASITSPTPIGNQRNRCLKLAFSDGYYPNGQATNSTSSNSTNTNNSRINSNKSSVMVAMEIQPIPNLSVHSSPGIKVVLRGPIDVRFGVLMLHPGNASVLGGCVEALVAVQRKAMELAKKVAGVGVDPTVKALIWNPHTGMEEEEDEGEQESRDVQIASSRRPSPTNVLPTGIHNGSLQQQQNQVEDIENLNGTGGMMSGGGSSSSRSSSHGGTMQLVQNGTSGGSSRNQYNNNTNGRITPARTATNSTGTTPPSNNMYSVITNNVTNQRVGSNNTSTPTTFSTSMTTSSVRRNNPYSKNSNSNSSNNNNMNANTNRSSASNSNNPYARSSTRPTRINTNTTTTTTSFGTSETPVVDLITPVASKQMETPNNAGQAPRQQHQLIDSSSRTTSAASTTRPQHISPPASQSSTTSSSSIITKTNQATRPAVTAPSHLPQQQQQQHQQYQQHQQRQQIRRPNPNSHIPPLSPTATSEPLSFLELRSLLESTILLDQAKYEEYVHRTFVVPCKIHTQENKKRKSYGFNIEKNKNWKKLKKSAGGNSKKNDKYEYSMSCCMTGPNEQDGVIWCKISSSIIETCMGISPAEMRDMNRKDREKANKIATEGGTQILSEFNSLVQCNLKLLHPTLKDLSGDDENKGVSLLSVDDFSKPVLLLTKRND